MNESADRRQATVQRYSGLARLALAGGAPLDCEADTFTDGCFGAAAYTDVGDVPEGALRASLGCGNPRSSRRFSLAATRPSTSSGDAFGTEPVSEVNRLINLRTRSWHGLQHHLHRHMWRRRQQARARCSTFQHGSTADV
ncbi:hypothetical protein ACIBI9_14355 [Nonomuraea sp. NPDC050451]|uniref:hypothetical protein n=1 Tax=Nonomuraea sp. NPDC050451 TaxID=3364364 RepID=UPI00379007E3